MLVSRVYKTRMKKPISIIVACAGLLAGGVQASDTAHHLVASGGQIGVQEGIDDPWRFGLEYRFPAWSAWRLRPALGGLATGEGSRYVYAGLQREFEIGDHGLVIPSFSAGYYDDGDEVKLGHELEFRSGLEFAWRFDNNARVGLGVYHLSNAGLGDDNPGTETVVLSLAWPLPRL